MTDTTDKDAKSNEMAETLKVAAACVGLAFLVGCMVVAFMLPVYLFTRFAGV